MSNFPPWDSSNSSQWCSNSHNTSLPLHAPILPPIQWLPPNPKFYLLVTIFSLSCHICHISAIRYKFVILVIESFIICCHRLHGISFQVAHIFLLYLPLPWELISFTNSNSLDHYMIFDTTSTSNNTTLPMCSNLDEYHAKCVGNIVIQRLYKLPNVFMNPFHFIFLDFIIYVTHLNLNMVK